MKIDFHNHFFPPEYLKRLEQWGRRYEFVQDPTGLKIVKEKGARFLGITSQHVSPEQRISDMDRIGIDIQVLTLTTPNVYFSTRKRNLYLAEMSNDFFADLCQNLRKKRRLSIVTINQYCKPQLVRLFAHFPLLWLLIDAKP